MENKIIALDTSILIDYFRKKNKQKSAFVKLAKEHQGFAISVITRFEVFVGSSDQHQQFWHSFFKNFRTLPLTFECADVAVAISRRLKETNKQISLPDLLIAATAISHSLPLATLNLRHFGRIPELDLYRLN